jgi:hypothetical protein
LDVPSGGTGTCNDPVRPDWERSTTENLLGNLAISVEMGVV